MKHFPFKKFTCTFLAFALAFALAGCMKENLPEEEKNLGPVFIVSVFYPEYMSILVDANGNELSRGEAMPPWAYSEDMGGYSVLQYFSLSSTLPSGEQKVTLYTIDGTFVASFQYEDEILSADGISPIFNIQPSGESVLTYYAVTCTMPSGEQQTSLYSTSGDMVIDFQPRNYNNAFGNFVLREIPSSYCYDLVNPHTGQVVQEGIYPAQWLNENCLVLFRSVNDDTVTNFFVDFEGNILLEGVPTLPFRSINRCGNYYMVSNFSEQSGLFEEIILDENFKPIFSPPPDVRYISYSGISSYFFVVRLIEEGHGILATDVVDVSTGEIVLQQDNLLTYNDEVYTYIDTMKPFTPPITLCRTSDGTVLAVSDSLILTLEREGGNPTRYYYMNEEAETITCIDINGTVLAEAYFPNLSRFHWYSSSPYFSIVWANDDETLWCFVVDENLNVISPEGILYTPMAYYAEEERYCGMQLNSARDDGMGIWNVLDTDGNILFELVCESLSCYNGYLYVHTDVYTGIMDYDGNWIYQIETPKP